MLDESVERGSRVLQLLNEHRIGRVAGRDRPSSASRCRRRRAATGPSPIPRPGASPAQPRRGRPSQAADGAARGPRRRACAGRAEGHDATAREAVTSAGDGLRELAAPCPTRSSTGWPGRGAILAVAHENPDADTLGATLGVARIAARSGAQVTTVCADPPPPAYDVHAGRGFVPDRPGRDDRLRPARHRRTRARSSGPAASSSATGTCCCGLPRVTIDHHVSSEAHAPADWIDASYAATCEMVALLATRARRAARHR